MTFVECLTSSFSVELDFQNKKCQCIYFSLLFSAGFRAMHAGFKGVFHSLTYVSYSLANSSLI